MSDITMPKMGFDMSEGTIVRWLKQVGEAVKKGEAIAEIETDKVTIEIESFDSGTLTQIVAGEGAVVPVGGVIAKLDEPDGASAAAPPTNGAARAATQESPSPAAADNAAAVQPAENPLAVGESGAADTAKAQPSSRLAAVEGTADRPEPTATPAGGQPRPPASTEPAQPGYGSDEQPEDFLPGAPQQDPQGAPAPAIGDQIEPTTAQAGAAGHIFASPMAKRLAREQHFDLGMIKGSGPGGRIVRRDVEAFAKQPRPVAPAPAPLAAQPAAPAPQPAAPAAPATPAAQPAPTPVAAPAGAPAGTRRVPLSRLRQTIARRLVQSKGPVPHFYVTTEIDMGALIELRKQVNAVAVSKITVNDFIVKASAMILKQFPVLNASFAEDALEYHDYIHVSIAVATDNGLLAPAVTDVDKKSLGTISAEAKEMIERTRNGKATPDELTRGTFTVSNLGMYPVDSFVAIINPPQAAIVAVGAAVETPVVRNGEIVIGHMMKATISVDHRVSDGAVAAEYMQALKKLLESPMQILL